MLSPPVNVYFVRHLFSSSLFSAVIRMFLQVSALFLPDRLFFARFHTDFRDSLQDFLDISPAYHVRPLATFRNPNPGCVVESNPMAFLDGSGVSLLLHHFHILAQPLPLDMPIFLYHQGRGGARGAQAWTVANPVRCLSRLYQLPHHAKPLERVLSTV